MSKKGTAKNRNTKHMPLRTCIGCRLVLQKKELTRIVNTVQGIRIDPTGKMQGRGAYLHNTRSCWEKGLKGPIEHALKVHLTMQDKALLVEMLDSLPAIPEKESEME